MHFIFRLKKLVFCCTMLISSCVTAQQTTKAPYRSSIAGILPNRYIDPDARRISITIKTPPSEHIGEIPDITSLPYAFPASSTPTPVSPINALLFQYTLNKQQAPALVTQLPDKKIAQKKSLFFCCSTVATKKQ